MVPMDLTDRTIVQLSASNGILVPRVSVARSFWKRFVGRLGTSDFPMGEGLLIVPCSEIHMIGMKYALDIVFLDKALTILATRQALPVGTLQLACKEAWATLELPVGSVDGKWREGLKLEMEVT